MGVSITADFSTSEGLRTISESAKKGQMQFPDHKCNGRNFDIKKHLWPKMQIGSSNSILMGSEQSFSNPKCIIYFRKICGVKVKVATLPQRGKTAL